MLKRAKKVPGKWRCGFCQTFDHGLCPQTITSQSNAVEWNCPCWLAGHPGVKKAPPSDTV